MSQTVLNLDGRSGQPLADFPVENAVSVQRLLAHKFPIDWFEAVAILLRTSEESEGRELSFDREHVIVRSDGSVTVTATAARSSSVDPPVVVQNAAALLRELLPETFPAPLRLTLTQALSTPPAYPSLREFAEALKYFERPDRTSVVRSVFDRWRAFWLEQLRLAAKTTAANPDNHNRTPATEHSDTSASRRRAIVWAIASASTVAVVMTLWIAITSGGMRTPAGPLARVGASVVQTIVSTAGRLVDRLRFSPSIPDATVAAAVPPVAGVDASPAVPAPSAAPRSIPSARARATQAPLRTFSARPLFDPFGALTPPVVIPRPELNVFLDPPALGITTDAETETRAVEVPFFMPRIYSAIDDDVAPPTAVYPHLPASAFIARDGALAFDVVIDEAGRVESVKSRPATNTVRNTLRLTMSLSAAKSWRFQPATKDGREVKYRHTIWLPIP